MFLIDSLIEKFAGKALMSVLLKLKSFMDGKKTYTGSALGIVAALVGYLSGNIDAKEASATIWLSGMFIFREASAAAKLKKAKCDAEAALGKTKVPGEPVTYLVTEPTISPYCVKCEKPLDASKDRYTLTKNGMECELCSYQSLLPDLSLPVGV
jgi:hypothetical protein